jgi:orotate phosphoribosyltransferase
MTRNEKKLLTQSLMEIKAVEIRAKNPFVYSSGNKGPIYFDLRLIMSFPRIREQITLYYLDLIEAHYGFNDFDIISGTATAGIPLASWVAQALRKPMIYVRSKQKEYGKQNLVEGLLSREDRVLIVEDIVNFGVSSLANVHTVRKMGGKVTSCLSIANYEQKEAMTQFSKSKVSLYSMITVAEVVNMAHELKLIDTIDFQATKDWLTEPVGWFERQGV